LIYVLRKIFEKENEKHQKQQKEKIKDIMKEKRKKEKDEAAANHSDGEVNEDDLW